MNSVRHLIFGVALLSLAGLRPAEAQLAYEMHSTDTGSRFVIINGSFDHEDDLSKFEDLVAREHPTAVGLWLLRAPIEWRERSDRFKALINGRFGSAGSPRVDVQGDTVILDALVAIGGKRVAVEFEVSKNLDNGLFSLRMAVQQTKVADFGVIIVPLSPRRPGTAGARNALNRLDEGYHGSDQSRNGAVYRVVVVRWLDVCERLAGVR